MGAYYGPFDQPDNPDASYQNGNAELGIPGSIADARAWEWVQRELVNAFTAAGLTPSHTDNTQLLQLFGILAPRIATNPIIYVRPDGNDANDGSANTAAKAFATIAAAAAKAGARYANIGTAITIQLGVAGTYAMPGSIPPTLGTLVIKGDVANQGAYILSGSGPVGGSQSCVGSTGGAIELRGVTLANTGTSNHTLGTNAGGSVFLQNVSFTSVSSGGFAHMVATNGASITIGSGCTIAGPMGSALQTLGGSITINAGVTLTVVGTPAFSNAFANSSSVGLIYAGSGASVSGTATGARYSASLNGIINTGGGANFFPGSTAGSTALGGQYA
ncbi:hypothetical protein [Methylobacterium durans]|uniref:Uncharacterized protein n=1 Tax=Methylobacterium durans TaxID=2202825 RepID=A0A2U8WD03_9HYPH|nr:hypothetical protein [Methylobacterium durans]AWN43176.1 hypothetical protein DK389_25115 [Methylobacterium durans]